MLGYRFRKPAAAIIFSLLVLFFQSLFGVSFAADFSPAMIRRVSPAVKLLVTEDSRGNIGQGTGFFVSPEGHLLTNYHVVEGSRTAAIVEDKKVYMVTRIIAFDKNADVALVMTEYPRARIQHLSLRRSMVELGESIMVLGYPQALQLGTAITLTKGNVSSIRPAGANTLVQFTAAVAGGSSGSPIIDKNGEVAGIVTSELKLGQSMFLGLSSPSISRHVGRHISTGRAAATLPRGQTPTPTPPRPITPPTQPRPTPPPATESTPVTAQEIREAQAILNELGFNAGSVDGKTGPQTESALKAFQRNRGVTQDGRLTKAMLEMLRSVKRERERAAQPVLRPAQPVTLPVPVVPEKAAPVSDRIREVRRFKLGKTATNFAAISPDGRTVIIGGGLDGSGYGLWLDISSGAIKGTSAIAHAAFSPDGKLMIAAHGYRTGHEDASLFDVVTGNRIRSFDDSHVSSVSFSSDGYTVATGNNTGTVTLWDIRKDKPIRILKERDAYFTYKGRQHKRMISSAVYSTNFSPDGQFIIATMHGGDSNVIIWDVKSGKEIAVLDYKTTSRAVSAVFSPDGRSVLMSGRNPLICDASSWEVIRFFERADVRTKYTASFSPDGSLVLTSGCWGKMTAQLWSIETGKEVLAFGASEGPMTWAAFTPDGRRILTMESWGTVILWELLPQ